MAEEKILKLRVSLKGRPLRTYSFGKEVITVGRSPECDVFLDNPGISRGHLKLVRGAAGHYKAEDAGSANGTFLNEEPLGSEFLMHDDVLRIGKFSLWVAYDVDRRGEESTDVPPPAPAGTTVLSTDELTRMMRNAKQDETRIHTTGASLHPTPRPQGKSNAYWGAWIAGAFVAGSLVGGMLTRLLLG